MTEQSPQFLSNVCFTPLSLRQAFAGVVCSGGIVDRDSLLVTTGGAGLDLSIAEGSAFIVGDDDAPDQGVYSVRNDGAAVITAAAADPSNPRIDRVVATVRDSDYGGVDDDWIIQIITGTPTIGATLANLAGSPAEPDNSITLAYVLVPTSFAGPFVNATHILDMRSRFIQCGENSLRFTRWARTTNQTFGDGSESILTYPSGPFGTALGNDWLTQSSGVMTMRRTGLILVRAGVAWAPHADALRRRTRIEINGAVDEANAVSGPALNSGAQRTAQSVTWVGAVAAGETISVQCVQNSGVSLDVQLAAFSITELGWQVA